MKLIHKLGVVFALIAALIVISPTPASARPSGPIGGSMELEFNLGWTEPQTEVPIWVGTVDLDGVSHPMAFFNIGTGLRCECQPIDGLSFFEEIWKIYEPGELTYQHIDGVVTDFVEGDIAMVGTDRGVGFLEAETYAMTGRVTDTNREFKKYDRHFVVMWGTFESYPFGAPHFAPGEFRVF